MVWAWPELSWSYTVLSAGPISRRASNRDAAMQTYQKARWSGSKTQRARTGAAANGSLSRSTTQFEGSSVTTERVPPHTPASLFSRLLIMTIDEPLGVTQRLSRVEGAYLRLSVSHRWLND